MDKKEEELLKLNLLPDEVNNPELFLEKIRNAKTHEDWEEVRAIIQKLSIMENHKT